MNSLCEIPTPMEEGGRGGSSCFRTRKRAVKISKYMSKAQKHRLLEGKGHGTSPDQHQERALAMARFIQKHRKTGDEVKLVPSFGVDVNVVTGRMFGWPIIQSVSKMLSEYNKESYGVDSEVVEVPQYFEVQSDKHAYAQCAKYYHVNFKAKLKDEDVKIYFAEVIVFMFRFSVMLCRVNTSLPVDYDDSGNPCKCLFPDCHLEHPSQKTFRDDGRLMKPCSEPFFSPTRDIFKQLCSEPSGRFLEILWYQSRKTATKLSKDIPMPSALVMAKHMINSRKPRRGKPLPPRSRTFLKVLPDCYSQKCDDVLEEVNGLIISEKRYSPPYKNTSTCCRGVLLQTTTWLHMNFSAKHKNTDRGVSENLYFAEVVEIRDMILGRKYYTTFCVPIDDEKGAAGNCGICNPELQIFHPRQVSYVDDTSKMDPSKYFQLLFQKNSK